MLRGHGMLMSGYWNQVMVPVDKLWEKGIIRMLLHQLPLWKRLHEDLGPMNYLTPQFILTLKHIVAHCSNILRVHKKQLLLLSMRSSTRISEYCITDNPPLAAPCGRSCPFGTWLKNEQCPERNWLKHQRGKTPSADSTFTSFQPVHCLDWPRKPMN